MVVLWLVWHHRASFQVRRLREEKARVRCDVFWNNEVANTVALADAGLLGKRVIVLGDAFYRNAPFSDPVERLGDVAEVLGQQLSDAHPPPSQDATRGFFAALWQRTYPGELYVAAPDNIRRFGRSLSRALDDRDAARRSAASNSAFRMSA